MWTIEAFDDYRALYPDTPPLDLPSLATTERFADAWALSTADLDRAVQEGLAGVTVVFVRGYLGNWMPGNLVGPMRALKELGIDAQIARNAAGATVTENARTLQAQLAADRILLCGHSKGGLECLSVQDSRVIGVVLSQTPRGPSAVLESLLLRSHEGSLPGRRRWLEEWTQRIGLHTIGAASGGRELTSPAIEAVIAGLPAPRVPVWQTASWSSQPTTWLDSFHERLGEVRPGCAHDGQFFLEDLLWPGLPHVLLAHVDHAQPVMGGFGFDEVRYWKALLVGFMRDAVAGA